MRLFILMLKKAFKKTLDGKVTANHTADGKGLCYFPVRLSEKKTVTLSFVAGNAALLERNVTDLLHVCVLQGLTCHSTDTYETIRMDKKPIV